MRKISEERKENRPQIFCGVVNCFAAAGVGFMQVLTPCKLTVQQPESPSLISQPPFCFSFLFS
jgi:hypothetical protein